METKGNILLLVDQQSRVAGARFYHQRINPLMEASHFKQLAYTICDNVWAIAVIGEEDRVALQLYRQTGYDVFGVNGNRSQKLKEILREVKRWAMSSPFTQIVLVTASEDLLELTRQLPHERTKVHVWAPERLLSDSYKHTPYNFRDLDRLMRPNPQVKIYWDYENLHIALERMGIHPNPKKLFQILHESVTDLGDIVGIHAYADWGELEKHSQMDIQRSLALLGVETSYLINHHDKNSADMRVARDLYLTLERDTVDIIVIVSGDRDFRDVVKALRESGKTIVLVGIQSTMNTDIAAVAHHVRYLDDVLKTPTRSGSTKEKGVLADDHNLVLIRLIKVFEQRDYLAIEQAALVRIFGIMSVQELIQQEVLVSASSDDKKMFELNYKVLQVEQMIYLAHWVVQRIEIALDKMPWVDSNYLSKGMQLDSRLAAWQLAQTRPSAEYWLNLLETAGIIVRIKQVHPNNPECIINTWWTPNKAMALRDSSRKILANHQSTVVTK